MASPGCGQSTDRGDPWGGTAQCDRGGSDDGRCEGLQVGARVCSVAGVGAAAKRHGRPRALTRHRRLCWRPKYLCTLLVGARSGWCEYYSKSQPPCFTEDEGRPLEVGLQEQASNRHKLHWSRAIVVNVDGKGGARLRQVRIKETNASEPLMTCRNVLNDVETGTRTSVPRIKVEGSLPTAQPASGMKAA